MEQDIIEKKRHSLAHLLAAAVIEIYPKAKPTIGPAIENGFYYDFDELKISDSDLPTIEKKMKEIVKSWKKFSREEISAEEASERFRDNPYKNELVEELIRAKEKITVYTCGKFADLCRGGHIENPAENIDPGSWKLSRIAGAYWRGNEKNKMLTRIYGLAFGTKKELDEYEKWIEEAKKRDHKKLGAELDLFVIDEEVGKGLPLWTPKGTIIKLELEKFTRDLEKKYGYEHISTPYLGSEKLYQKSGHLAHYRQNMYAPIDMDGDIFYLRPMACPHHIRMLQRKPISYRDLPIRYAEIADYNRYEKSGELMGMIRLRKFQLTDAHIFAAPSQLKDEFKMVCALIQEGMAGLGLENSISYRFSKRDPKDKEKYYPDDELWNKAETLMREALDEIKIQYVEAEGEAAFYGPKLDIQAKNANGKEDTLFTAQIDFLLPEKFDIEYTDENGQKKRPVMIHRSAFGALERTFAFLIEKYAGSFPLWLSPIQIAIVPVSEKFNSRCESIISFLKDREIRSKLYNSNESLGKKIREIKIQKIPYWAVVGEKEMSEGSLSVENRNSNEAKKMSPEELSELLLKEIKKRA